MTDSPLHDLPTASRFSNRAADYRRYRPDYPARAIDAILQGLGDPARREAADVGAGTGISARMLAERGLRVQAIEPNAAMRSAAEPHPRVEFREGTAEATALPASSVDLVLSAQAFHWFRVPEAVAEFHRILRPSGKLALMWNERDRDDPPTLRYIEAVHEVNGEHPAETRTLEPEVLTAAGLFGPPTLELFEHHQDLELEGIVGLAASASYVTRDGPQFERLRELLLRRLAEHRDARGLVRLKYRTSVHIARPV